MRRAIFAVFNGFLLLQLVASQARTAWQAGVGGMGLATMSPPDFSEYQQNMAIVGINSATTEQAAIKAATQVYHPTLDMGDNVKQALENKVRQLRAPPGWNPAIPPPLPFGFDVMNLIMGHFYQGAHGAAMAAAAPAARGPTRPVRRRPGRRAPPAAPAPRHIARAPARPHTGAPAVAPAVFGGFAAPGGFAVPGAMYPGAMYPGVMYPGMHPMYASGPMSMIEPSSWEVDMAQVNIRNAKTEPAAAKAAAAVYRIGRDFPDNVLSTLEDHAARLLNPGWTLPYPPPLPFSYRPMNSILKAFNELHAAAQAKFAAEQKAAAPAPAAPAPRPRPPAPAPVRKPAPRRPPPRAPAARVPPARATPRAAPRQVQRAVARPVVRAVTRPVARAPARQTVILRQVAPSTSTRGLRQPRPRATGQPALQTIARIRAIRPNVQRIRQPTLRQVLGALFNPTRQTGPV